MKSNKSLLAEEFLRDVQFRLDENMRMVHKSFEFLQEEDVWKGPNKASNSIGNIIIHLCGNITQYALSGLGKEEDHRRREEEFDREGGFTKEELLKKLTSLIHIVKERVRSVTDEQLTAHYQVQGFDLSGAGILLHVVEHFSYHTGQIAFWVKILRNEDLGFYDGVDLNQKNDNEC